MMARRVLGCCAVALFLHLSGVASVKMLNNINDLKRNQLDQSVLRHSRNLLHWFANQVDMCDNGIQLNFDPNSDYGSHHYGNYERLLPRAPAGYHYYTVGNLNERGAEQLPDDVRHQQHDNDGYNLVRIIFRVHGQAIDLVFLTQHYGNSQDSAYDPDRTYQISNRLLRQLSEGSPEQLPTSYSRSPDNLEGRVSLEISSPVVRRQQQSSKRCPQIKKCLCITTVITIVIALVIILAIVLRGK